MLGTLLILLCASCLQIRAFCPFPSAPQNGYVERHDEADTHVTYHCYEGFLLKGNTENFCLADSYWAFVNLPQCEAILCPELPQVLFGELSPKGVRVHGTIVHVECLYSTLLQGADRLECNNGKWDKDPPTCTVRRCEEIDVEGRHLRIVYGTTEYGHMLEFECSDPKLTMVGESEIYCEGPSDNVAWDKKAPHCIGVDTTLLPSTKTTPLPIVYSVTPTLGDGVVAPQCQDVKDKHSDSMAVLARGDYCYSFINKDLKFYDAKAKCDKAGGELVSIHDEGTNDWLVETLRNLDGWNNADTWIGLKYKWFRWNDGGWVWVRNGDMLPHTGYSRLVSYSWYSLRRHPGHCLFIQIQSGDGQGAWDRDYCSSGLLNDYKHKVVCQNKGALK